MINLQVYKRVGQAGSYHEFEATNEIVGVHDNLMTSLLRAHYVVMQYTMMGESLDSVVSTKEDSVASRILTLKLTPVFNKDREIIGVTREEVK